MVDSCQLRLKLTDGVVKPAVASLKWTYDGKSLLPALESLYLGVRSHQRVKNLVLAADPVQNGG